jgi:hypothetical protein
MVATTLAAAITAEAVVPTGRYRCRSNCRSSRNRCGGRINRQLPACRVRNASHQRIGVPAVRQHVVPIANIRKLDDVHRRQRASVSELKLVERDK